MVCPQRPHRARARHDRPAWPARSRHRAGPGPAARTAPADVLLVEDDDFCRQALARLLEADGLAVAQAADGREALRLLREGPPPRLVLLDLVLPHVDGWQVAEALDRGPWLPVIVVSASADLPASPRIVGHFRKPIVVAELLRSVRRHCPDRG
jgi:CheY-like chemotaxis protein